MGRIMESFVKDLARNTEGPEDIKNKLMDSVSEASVLSSEQLANNIERAFYDFADRYYVRIEQMIEERPDGNWTDQIRFETMIELEQDREIQGDWVIKARTEPPVEAEIEVVYPMDDTQLAGPETIELANEDWDQLLIDMADEAIGMVDDKVADIGSVAEDVIRDYAEKQSAQTHSSSVLYEERLPDWVYQKNLDWMAVANFGDYWGVNGDVQDDSPDTNGYETLSSLGGRIPTNEEEIPGEMVVETVLNEAGLEPQSAMNYELAVEVLEGYGYDKNINMVYWTVSGESHVYVEEHDEGEE